MKVMMVDVFPLFSTILVDNPLFTVSEENGYSEVMETHKTRRIVTGKHRDAWERLRVP